MIERSSVAEPENGFTTGVPGESSRRVEWMRLLWQERRLIGRATAFGLILSLLIAFLLPVRYQSKTRLMPPDQQSGSGLAMLAALAGRGAATGGGTGVAGGLGGSLGSMAGDLLGLKSSGALVIDMLGGPTIQDGVIEKFDLRKVYGRRYWEDARKDLARHTTIKEDKKSGVVTIAVEDRDPHRAQEMAQAYVEALNHLMTQVSTSSARRERIFLEQRLKTVKQNLDTAEQQFSEYASKSGTLDLPSQSRAMVESEATLQGQLIAAQSELEGLEQIYTDSNIRIRTLRARVNSLKHEIENFSGNKSDLASDESPITGDFPSIRKLPRVGVQWMNFYRESKIEETVYELLTQEYEIAKVQEAKEIPTMNTLDQPLLPERKSFPPRILITLLGGAFALLLGCTVVIGAAAWKHDQSPEKQLVAEIWAEIGAREHSPRIMAHQLWSKLGGRNGRSGKSDHKVA